MRFGVSHFLCLGVILVLALFSPLVSADVPNVNEVYIEFKASPDNSSLVLFSIRHSGASVNHHISRIQLEVDGEVIELDPLSPSEQVGETVIYYEFVVDNLFTKARARAFCNLHGWSRWNQLENRLFKLEVEPVEGMGSTDPEPDTYSYEQVEEVQVAASPDAGWMFSHWMLDGEDVGRQNPYPVNMTRNHKIQAVFIEGTPPPVINYTLTIEEPEGLGSTEPFPGNYDYVEDAVVVITAISEEGWELSHWIVDGENIGDENPYTISMDKDRNVLAVFMEPPPITLFTFIIATPEGSGITDPESGTYIYYETNTIPVKAIPDTGWIFDHWELDREYVGTETTYIITVDGDHELKAVFIEEPEDVTENRIPGYSITSILIGIGLILIIPHTRNGINVYKIAS